MRYPYYQPPKGYYPQRSSRYMWYAVRAAYLMHHDLYYDNGPWCLLTGHLEWTYQSALPLGEIK